MSSDQPKADKRMTIQQKSCSSAKYGDSLSSSFVSWFERNLHTCHNSHISALHTWGPEFLQLRCLPPSFLRSRLSCGQWKPIQKLPTTRSQPDGLHKPCQVEGLWAKVVHRQGKSERNALQTSKFWPHHHKIPPCCALGAKKNNFLQTSCLIFSPRNKLLPFHSWPTAQGQTGPRPPQIQKCSLIDDPKFQQMKLGSLFTKATTGSWLKNAQPCYKRNMTLNCYIFHQRFSP